MSQEANVDRLAQIRKDIDSLDKDLLALLNRRAGLSLEVGRIKAGGDGKIYKPRRELEVLDKLCACNSGPLSDDHLRNIWREIFSSSRELQRPQHVAYLGPEGTFSYFAAVEYLGRAVNYQPCRDLPEVFASVVDGQCSLGVVPLENSLQGTVGVSFDLFFKHDVRIQAELFLHISHCLLSNETDLSSIRTVYSHPQPLMQCGSWLRTHLPEAHLVPTDSTAAAAIRASEEPNAAAVGNISLATMHDMNVLARAIEDDAGNWTRFVLISTPGAETENVLSPLPGRDGDEKTSLLFTLQDKPGALSTVLNSLARANVNMRKLESRPMRGERWKYVFFTDVECNLRQPRYAGLVEELRSVCASFRILGSYTAGIQLDRVHLENS